MRTREIYVRQVEAEGFDLWEVVVGNIIVASCWSEEHAGNIYERCRELDSVPAILREIGGI